MHRAPVVLLACLSGCALAPVACAATRAPLAAPTLRESGLADELRSDVTDVAVGIGERHAGRREGLEFASSWVDLAFSQAGYAVTVQRFAAPGGEFANLEAVLPGRGPGVVVVGAHYDTAEGTPGADDNASGVAALLAIARALRGTAPERTVRFVAFANEEPPYFQTGGMGAVVYAKACKARGDRIEAMISLESLGFYADARGSQAWPWYVRPFYPSTGDFLAIIGDRSSRGLVRRARDVLRAHGSLPVETGAVPGWVEGAGWSDHWAFQQEGWPAIMATDTAVFRNPHYHEATDTPDTLDWDRFARAVAGLEAVVRDLAGIP
jgi:hypothetical protein